MEQFWRHGGVSLEGEQSKSTLKWSRDLTWDLENKQTGKHLQLSHVQGLIVLQVKTEDILNKTDSELELSIYTNVCKLWSSLCVSPENSKVLDVWCCREPFWINVLHTQTSLISASVKSHPLFSHQTLRNGHNLHPDLFNPKRTLQSNPTSFAWYVLFWP